MTEKDPLADVRTRIDKIDTTIQRLVSERAECAAKVAEIKNQQGETGHFYRPEREAQVLQAVKDSISLLLLHAQAQLRATLEKSVRIHIRHSL